MQLFGCAGPVAPLPSPPRNDGRFSTTPPASKRSEQVARNVSNYDIKRNTAEPATLNDEGQTKVHGSVQEIRVLFTQFGALHDKR